MEDQLHHDSHPITTKTTATAASSSSSAAPSSVEPVRSRWTPKPEQILILESIFNSGMVNPPKDETVRIRKLLEQYGSVGDANVFYWFQNRRSRSRRRQRQLQAASLHPNPPPPPPPSAGGGSTILERPPPSSLLLGFQNNNSNSSSNNNSLRGSSFQVGPAPSSEYEFCGGGCGGGKEAAITVGGGGSLSISAAHLGFLPSDHHHPSPSFTNYHIPNGGGIITVFVNGVATQVPAGSFDVKAMFGEDGILVHSTGIPVPVNDFGISLHSLHHGESYFLAVDVSISYM
ncbi:hypothetical protein V2J09_003217 [Rumex salicifolius]